MRWQQGCIDVVAFDVHHAQGFDQSEFLRVLWRSWGARADAPFAKLHLPKHHGTMVAARVVETPWFHAELLYLEEWERYHAHKQQATLPEQ